MSESDIIERLRAAGIPHVKIAAALGRAQPAATRLMRGERQLKANEIPKLEELLRNETAQKIVERAFSKKPAPPSQPDAPPTGEDENAYMPIEVLPTYAGAGGGGTGEGEPETALVPRRLIVGELRGQQADFLLINIRGDSMEPDFRHGDQILIDRRDKSPAQPGPFALWDGEWGEYVLKNVERDHSGRLRIFSSNPKYQHESLPADQTRIIGRPVWYGRRL